MSMSGSNNGDEIEFSNLDGRINKDEDKDKVEKRLMKKWNNRALLGFMIALMCVTIVLFFRKQLSFAQVI